MAKTATTKIYKSDGRHSLYLPSDLVADDRFPFKVGETLTVIIEGQELIVRRVK
jgi:hypothetical protein